MKKIIKEIEALNNRYTKAIDNPLFSLLSVKDYVVFFPEILKMHEEDFKMKNTILEDILQQEDSEVLVIYISTWLMSPKIDTLRLKSIQEIFDTENTLISKK